MSMTKIITPGAQDFHEPVAELLKISSRGLRGSDLDHFVKRASVQFMDKFASIKWHPGEIPVHLIAVGAKERYGSNRNGDAFSRAVCREYHPTFQKYARWYRNHQNKDTSKGRGVIKMSAFNDDMDRIELLLGLNGTKEAADHNGGLLADDEMEKLARGEDIPVSMACARPGTLVCTSQGFMPVECVGTGDQVLTHKGRFRRVYNTMQLQRQQYCRIATKYYGRQTIEMTPDHKFWVARWRDLPKGSTANNLPNSKEADGVCRATKKRRRGELHLHAKYVPCGELQAGDLLLMPIRRGAENEVAVADARVLGYYTAEGSLVNAGTHINYACHKNDDLVDEINKLVDSHVATTSVSFLPHSGSDKAVSVNVYNRELAALCETQVGRRVENKKIPDMIWEATAVAKLHFMASWLNGDGWQDEKGIHWSTASRSLSIELQMLLASVGLPSTTYRIDHTSDLPHGKPRTGDGIEYTVNLSNRYSGYFADIAKVDIIEKQAEKTTTFITGNYLAIPVRDVEIIERECDVYDLSVEDDESFTVFGLAVSNCRVSHDICSGCNNKARTRREYCGPDSCVKYGGCRDNLAKTFEDGHTLCVNNPDPSFFDISKVWRPADRIAYTMGKCAQYEEMLKAAHDAHEHVGGAEWAERLGVAAPLWVLEDGPWADPRLTGQLKVASQLMELEGYLNLDHELSRAFMPDVQPTASDLPEIKRTEKLGHVLAALAEQNCMLPIGEFICLVSGQGREKVAHVVEDVAAMLPGIYNRLASDPNLESRLRNNPYIPANVAPQKLKHWALKHAADWSLDRDRVVKRLQLSVLRHPKPPTPRQAVKVAAVTQAGELATEYAMYQLAFLQAAGAADEPELAQEMAIRHNYVK